MKLPIFASVILFTLILRRAIRRARRNDANAEKSFWEREAEANATRKQPLDDLCFLTIPLDALPMDTAQEDEAIADCAKLIRSLAEHSDTERVVNLTGITNTELKLRYGAANLPLLSESDERFTLLVQTLQKWADRLETLGFLEDSVRILEYEISIRADVGSAYRKLARHYLDVGTPERISGLIASAESLNSASRQSILRDLREIKVSQGS